MKYRALLSADRLRYRFGLASSAGIGILPFTHPILGTAQLASLFPWLYTLLHRHY